MNKWTKAAQKLKLQMDEANEKAQDMQTLLAALPHGQVKQLMKDETCAAILAKYGITDA